jgi:hypothetical protein
MDEEFGGFRLVFLADVVADGGGILAGVRTTAHRGEYQRRGFLTCHAAATKGGKENYEGPEHRLREAIV